MNLTRYAGNEGRGISYDLWSKCPREAIMADPNFGHFFRDDFMDLATGRYTITQATAGTFVLDVTTTVDGGVALADCNSTTDGQGINVQATLAMPFKPKAGQILYFEARVKAADIATGPDFFLGLAEQDTTILASSAISTANHLGFLSLTDNNILLHSGEKAGTAVTGVAIHTLVEDTYVKLGFKVTDASKVEWWVNGVKQATSFDLAAANIPVVGLTPSLVCQTVGTTDPIVHIDWWECFAHVLN